MVTCCIRYNSYPEISYGFHWEEEALDSACLRMRCSEWIYCKWRLESLYLVTVIVIPPLPRLGPAETHQSNFTTCRLTSETACWSRNRYMPPIPPKEYTPYFSDVELRV